MKQRCRGGYFWDCHCARCDVIHKLTKQPKDEVDDEDEKFEAAEAAPARHLDDFVRPPPLLRISLIWKGRGKERERMRETVGGSRIIYETARVV